ncbi:hypothetical protein BABINDRAFT_10540 [Babjeviella inositovora NRRL Y-12698]|uniref:Extracellular membrane protein CFEM domain-containing protein n=1 Tax=Babjeviella inositovora NRRL Y-12698 TaxID=984486 RepID=A0A1E3QH15_9ASCO|nr:uncharacterized protein BABINDRAFT_10540 [Babjeviella inositovora NRRL Y-12698]ODQ77003.1 hypothetical protein BABINDRAFT_10540 [Babjeviella inositovora NRRL Y-12698]
MVKITFKATLAVAAAFSMMAVICEEPYHIYSHEEYAVIACTGAIVATTTFCGKKAKILGQCYCANVPELGSLLACLHDNDYYTSKMVRYLENECAISYPNTTLDTDFFDKVYQNASQYIITPPSDMNATLISYTPITME